MDRQSTFLQSLLALLVLSSFLGSDAFSVLPVVPSKLVRNGSQAFTRLNMVNFFEKLKEEKPKEVKETTSAVLDENGKEFIAGGVVRVVSKKTKAYQVSNKATGRFNDDKVFVPDESIPNLLLPPGLRGVITKVYNPEEISANFPIQVKFVPDEQTEEGYSAPVPFTMHFLTSEVECV